MYSYSKFKMNTAKNSFGDFQVYDKFKCLIVSCSSEIS